MSIRYAKVTETLIPRNISYLPIERGEYLIILDDGCCYYAQKCNGSSGIVYRNSVRIISYCPSELNSSLAVISYARSLLDYKPESNNELELFGDTYLSILKKESNRWWAIDRNGICGCIKPEHVREVGINPPNLSASV
jgi:hypothetical protein